ncbi:HD-GYP domain-containing protein [Paenibacillus larvae]|uniref:Metal dependent phosphohydrolase n=1 Tax=Paenibacillus larvae subsp. larvae TaxID=147375 RepID=A0A6C0QLV8_9BACL|nr:HD-GYP domain-containing protein [Paenibacillus larvae]QHZ49248.1 metal dependent phosphohydrolase [Paenibacillus larvae subsp. larvae]
MPTVSVSPYLVGEQLAEDVLTGQGNVLMYKGKILNERDIEVLQAFLVSNIPVQNRKGYQEEMKKGEERETGPRFFKKNELTSFEQEYKKAVKSLKKLFASSLGGKPIPVHDFRPYVQTLIDQIGHYNILTFIPPDWTIEDYLFHNSILTGLTSYQLAKWYGISSKELMQVALAGVFHDIGNCKVDQGILQKPGPLEPEEIKEVRKHTVAGYEMLRYVSSLNEGAKLAALQHHEREDGHGYPLGLKGKQIHIYAKIVAIADMYHAMTSQRYHKAACSKYMALESLHNESFGKLHPALVQTFIRKITQFHTGTKVRLNDGRLGEIVFTDQIHPTRPWVNIRGTIINLSIERRIHIEEVLQT